MMCWTRPTQKPKQNPLCVHACRSAYIKKKKKKAAPFLGLGEEYGVRTSERTLKLICCASSWAWGSTGWRSLLGVSASRAVRMEQPHISQQKSWDLDTKKNHTCPNQVIWKKTKRWLFSRDVGHQDHYHLLVLSAWLVFFFSYIYTKLFIQDLVKISK